MAGDVMFWQVIPFLIVICSIAISIYVFRVTKNKKYFWTFVAFSGSNLLGGILFAIYINYMIGLISLIIPFVMFLKAFYFHLKDKARMY